MSKITVERASPERLKQLGTESWTSWECGVETFDWEYSTDETALVRAGRVRIRTEHGQELELQAGDLVHFPRGLRCTWSVLEPIRKVYTFR